MRDPLLQPGEELLIVQPRRVARGQQYICHLMEPLPEKGPVPDRALCGSSPASGWDHTSIGRRCKRCPEKAAKLGLKIPDRW